MAIREVPRTLLGAILLTVISAGQVKAGPIHGSYVQADPERVEVRNAASHTSNVIFLNGCFGTGCDITPGNESSIENTSSIINETHHIPPFGGGPMQWEAIVDCVRDTYKPFDIQITDIDPGSAPHFEAIVAGLASDAGFPGPVGGVAPFMCGQVINNAITFNFAQLVENDVAQTCWVIAQETAHVFGLDHEYLCSDPMTYIRSCDPNKRFQDVDARCGEYSARDCSCNGPTQNSYRTLLDHFGVGTPTPPSVSIERPEEGEEVSRGFIIKASASDDFELDRVELRINSVPVDTSRTPPFFFNAPSNMSDGRQRIEVTAYDSYQYSTTVVVEVLQGDPCHSGSDCNPQETCVSGRCVPGPGADGGFGQECTGTSDCASLLCGRSGETQVCTEACDTAGSCPEGFGCLKTSESSICWPGYDDRPGGCSTAQSWQRSQSAWLLGLLLLALRRKRLRV